MFEDKWNMVLREEAAKEYFSNLDDWNRTTFIDIPRNLYEFYYF
jgi:hypothetical protein